MRFGGRELALAGIIALVASLLAVTAIRGIALNVFDIPEGFEPLHQPSWIVFTVAGVLGAVLSCLVLNRITGQPLVAFQRLALIVLGLSLIPDFAAWADYRWPGTNAQSIGVLLAMHVAVGLICFYVLPWFGRNRRQALLQDNENALPK